MLAGKMQLSGGESLMRSAYLAAFGAVLWLGTTTAFAQDAIAEYRTLNKQIDGLMVYNALLERQLQDQQTEITELQNAIEGVPELERQIPPLLSRMVEGLEQFVAMDLPFLQQERNDRVAQLKSLLERADVNVAEKTRRVLEAWQIENEYGRTNLAYNGTLEIDGVAREVEFLRVGRIALLYQTPDAEYTGAWDQPRVPGLHSATRIATRYVKVCAWPELRLRPTCCWCPLPAPNGG